MSVDFGINFKIFKILNALCLNFLGIMLLP